jgi:peptide deformylase
MFETMYNASGVGLAAPQIGLADPSYLSLIPGVMKMKRLTKKFSLMRKF